MAMKAFYLHTTFFQQIEGKIKVRVIAINAEAGNEALTNINVNTNTDLQLLLSMRFCNYTNLFHFLYVINVQNATRKQMLNTKLSLIRPIVDDFLVIIAQSFCHIIFHV